MAKKKKKAKSTKKQAAKKTGKKGAKKAGKKAAKKATKKLAKKAAKKVAKKAGKKTAKKAAKKAGRKPAAKKAGAGAKKAKKKASKPRAPKVATPPPAAVTEPAATEISYASEPGAGDSSDEEEGGRSAPSTGDDAPHFSLPVLNAPTASWSLDDYVGRKNIVLYFYPKDDTPGCTVEACNFQQGLDTYEAHDTVVVGVSPDSVESHRKFAQKFGLNFPLLADTDREVAKLYGVWVKKKMYGRESMGIQRSTFLINKKGKIARAWTKVKVEGHSDEVLNALQSL